MSYCGACGTFYWPECPHRKDGGCIPAVNPDEQKIVEAHAAVVAASARIAAIEAMRDPARHLDASALIVIADKLGHLFD